MKITHKICAALLAVCMLSAPLSAATDADWYARLDKYMTADEDRVIAILEKEAAKGADGAFADVSRAHNLSAVYKHTAYGYKISSFKGEATYTYTGNSQADAKAAGDAAVAEYSADVSDSKKRIMSAYIAFYHDHPELFWLTGSCLVNTSGSYSYDSRGRVEYSIDVYLVLYDPSHQFDIRLPEYTDVGAIRRDADRFNRAVDEILALPSVKNAERIGEKVDALNDALTARNSYFGGDMSNIPDSSRKALSALIGSTGQNGPVCSGYSEAFKVLCDRLGIPCVTISGDGISSASPEPQSHMWNAVKIGTKWYGVDVTWNDPIIRDGDNSAVSGYENDSFLLVGSDTIIDGRSFAESHIPDLTITERLYALSEHVPLSETAYNGSYLPFTDVKRSSPDYNGIVYVYESGLMNGVSSWEFSPDATLTRGMVVTVLWRMAGSPAANGGSQFTDVASGMWYTDAVAWASANGIVSGYGNGLFGVDDSVTYEQAIAMLQRYAKLSGNASTAGAAVSGYNYSAWADEAVRFAAANGFLPAEHTLTGNANRASIATMLYEFSR